MRDNKDSKPEFKPVKSNSIQAYSYNHESKELIVTFQSGVQYSYKDVMPDVMSQVFDRSRSVGKSFIRLIGSQMKGSKLK